MNKNNLIVQYHNDLNSLKLNNLQDKELELFYAICIALRDKAENEVVIELNKFIKEFNLNIKNKDRLYRYIISVHKKFLSLSYTLENDDVIDSISFFNRFKTDFTTNKMIISVNPRFTYLLNNLTTFYTKFSFVAFQKLTSHYAKLLFPYLQQWNNYKTFEIEKEKLFDLFALNENYRNRLDNFNNRILKPAVKELRTIFKDLKCSKLKNGKEITGYKFIWKETDEEKEHNDIVVVDTLEEIEISQSFKNLLERCKQYKA